MDNKIGIEINIEIIKIAIAKLSFSLFEIFCSKLTSFFMPFTQIGCDELMLSALK